MSVNNLGTFLNIKDSHLRVVSGNVYAQGINIGGITVDVAHGLQSITNQGNVTTNTLQFDNATTGFTTTANVTVGRDLTVTGNALVSSNLTVTGNAVISDDLTVTENLLVSNNLTVTGNTFYANPASVLVDSNVVTEYTGPHDRPLREYPEINMTAATTGGYTASASSNLTDKNPWEAFNPSDYWRSLDRYSTSDPYGYTGDEDITDTNGTLHEGEWLKLELPNKINISRVTFAFHSSGSFQPTSYVILGSNNDTSWTLIHTNENLSPGLSPSYLSEDNFTTVGYFKYLKLLVKNVIDATPSVLIQRLRYYGYEEGSGSLDTTLKSVYNVPATTGTQLEVYYDGRETSSYPESGVTVTDISPNTNDGTLNGGVGFDSTYKAFTFDGTGDYITNTRSGYSSSGTYTVSTWVNISKEASGQTNPNIFQYGVGQASTTDTGFGLITNSSDDRIQAFVYGNNDFVVYGIKKYGTWIHLTSIYELSASGTNITLYVNGNNVGSQATSTAAGIGATPHLSIGVQANASDLPIPGTYFNGSIANFRLYSKALNAGQIQELYDYQKDYFLGSKSQVTLYKGHLGVGVTEPSGQLELAGDERLQEYPPRGFGVFAEDPDYSTHIEGHGVFTAYGSSQNNTGKSYSVIGAFDKTISPDSSCWLSKAGTYSAGNPVSATAAIINGIQGEFIALKSPYPIKLKSFTTQVRGGVIGENSRMAKSGIIWGSNNGATWYQVHSWSGRVYSDGNPNYFEVNSTEYYSHHALQTTETQGNVDATVIGEWKLFGTPGPTTLDKGSLTLGRSLDVPRISRYDVDTETPRPEKLLVDYDTTVNSSPTDISGQGNHGAFYGDAKYSAADKAFVFDGTGDYIQGNLNNTGDTDFTVSCWFKRTADDGVETVWFIGGTSSNNPGNGTGLDINTLSDTRGYFYFYSGYELADSGLATVIGLNKWVHLVCTRVGNTMKIYLNGEDRNKPVTGTAHGLSLDANTEFRIGQRNSSGTNPAHGMVSNFKIYSVALEPSEVKKLYNLGRTGRSMVISDTAVGIGKVPEAQLDVRGNLNVSSFIKYDSAWFYANDGGANGGTTFNDYTGFVPWNQLQTGSKHFTTASASTSGGYYTAPVDGIYHFDTSVLNYPDARTGITGIYFSVNDSTSGESGVNSYGYNRKTGMPGQENMNASATFRLNEGDTVKVYVVNIDCYTESGHAFFSGYLVTRI